MYLWRDGSRSVKKIAGDEQTGFLTAKSQVTLRYFCGYYERFEYVGSVLEGCGPRESKGIEEDWY